MTFEDMKRTRSSFLLGMIKTRPGTAFSETQLKADAQLLLNMGLFATVEPRTEKTADGVKVIFKIREWGARIPIFQFGGIKENFWFDVGLKDLNWL
ncbi:MAG: hypothetical protein GY940_43995, partial [bacterium]|nr:hypothetical protein [bacterium]